MILVDLFCSIFSARSKDGYPDQYSPVDLNMNNHQKDELDAAEALTFLAGNCKSRWIK